MVKLIEMMLKENLVTKEAIAKLVRSRPPKKVSFANLIADGALEVETVETFLVKKIRQGVISLKHLEKIEGIDIASIIKAIAEELKIDYVDLDNKEIDVKLFSQVPYKQLIKYNAIPVEETDLNVLIVVEDPLDMEAQDVMQRLFPKKPIKIAIARPKQIQQHLQSMEINESVKGLIADIRRDLNQSDSYEDNEESPAVLKLIDIILKSAIFIGASDIHIEASEKTVL